MYKRNIKPLPFIIKPLPLIIPSRTIILFRFFFVRHDNYDTTLVASSRAV